jgi:hypothetical protein
MSIQIYKFWDNTAAYQAAVKLCGPGRRHEAPKNEFLDPSHNHDVYLKTLGLVHRGKHSSEITLKVNPHDLKKRLIVKSKLFLTSHSPSHL